MSYKMARKKRKIGMDYDGVIADTGEMKARLIKKRFNKIIPPWKTDRAICVRLIGKDNYEAISSEVYERNQTLAAPPIPGAYFGMFTISRTDEIYIVTARPPRRVNFAREWIDNLGASEFITEYRSIYDGKSRMTKGEICRELGLDTFLEDEERFLEEIDPNVRRMLLKNACREELSIPKGIELARSWEEILKLLSYRT